MSTGVEPHAPVRPARFEGVARRCRLGAGFDRCQRRSTGLGVSPVPDEASEHEAEPRAARPVIKVQRDGPARRQLPVAQRQPPAIEVSGVSKLAWDADLAAPVRLDEPGRPVQADDGGDADGSHVVGQVAPGVAVFPDYVPVGHAIYD